MCAAPAACVEARPERGWRLEPGGRRCQMGEATLHCGLRGRGCAGWTFRFPRRSREEAVLAVSESGSTRGRRPGRSGPSRTSLSAVLTACLKPCKLQHVNLQPRCVRSGGRWHSLANPYMRSFERNSDTDIWTGVDLLTAEQDNMSNAAFQDLQRNMGLHILEDSVVCNRDVREHLPPSTTCFDVLHNFHSGGIVAYEVFSFSRRLCELGISRADLATLVPRTFESARGERTLESLCAKLLDAYFGEKQWRIDGSTQQSILPLLHYWAVNFNGPQRAEMRAEFESLILLCERVVALSLLQFHQQDFMLDKLAALETAHHSKYCEAYGESAVRPKHHYTLHQTQQFRRYGAVLDTKACERKHQAMKEVVENQITRTTSFEFTVLSCLRFCEKQEQSKRPASWWQYTVQRKPQRADELRCPFQNVQVGSPLVWNLREGHLCMLLEELEETDETITLVGRRGVLKAEPAYCVCEWQLTAERISDTLKAGPQRWRPSRYWRKAGDSLLTIW